MLGKFARSASNAAPNATNTFATGFPTALAMGSARKRRATAACV